MNGDPGFNINFNYTSLNRQLAVALSTNTSKVGASVQNMGITDVLCEGPIAGLVNGASSVFLNDNSVEPEAFAGYASPYEIPSLEQLQSDLQALADVKINFNQANPNPDIGYLTQGFNIPTDFELGTGRKLNLQLLGAAVDMEATLDANTNTPVVTLTASTGAGSPFTTAWQTKDNENRFARLSLFGVVDCFGEVTYVSSTQLKFRPYYGHLNAFPTRTYAGIQIFYSYPILSVQTTGTPYIEVESGNTIPSDDYYFYVDKQPLSTYTLQATNDTPQFIKNFGVSFRAGKLESQQPFNELLDSTGGSSGIVGSNAGINLPELKQLAGTEATNLGITLIDDSANSYPVGQSGDRNSSPTILNSSDFGLDTAGKIREADEIYFTIKYPSLQSTNLGSGNHEEAFVYYIMQFDVKLDGAWNNNYRNIFQNYNEQYIIHSGDVLAPRSFEHRINLDLWRPFEDFRIRIIRVTRHIGLCVNENGDAGGRTDVEKWQLQAKASVDTLGAIIKDKFEFPGTAAAQVAFSGRQFQNIPNRSYHLRGKLVRIPSTYTPREESDTGLAKYEDFWGGDFKYPFYTDNPAWVFLDLLTNSRYGAGKWISTNDVDIYSLYRIARYCDELVEDGTTHNVTDLVSGVYYKIKNTPSDTDFTEVGAPSGYSIGTVFRATTGTPTSGSTGQVFGMEPRYRANIFLTRATDIYKVLKDMASIFAGIIYYLDSKVVAVQDVPQDPIYSFSQSNVIDGAFTYESTGSRTKTNQVIVTWNDPAINYTPVPLLVEDRESIARTGRIITENAVAFGCTSEGQATRLGKWKLWTAQNQTEIVNFATGLQGAFIRPGDIINVSDAKRTGIQYSGRTSSATSTTLTFDRPVSFNSGSTYELSTVVTKPTAIYVGAAPITINSVSYSTGDVLPEAYVYLEDAGSNPTTFSYQLVDLTNERLATNAFLDANGATELQTIWKNHTFVETNLLVNPGASATQVTLANSATFGTTPVANCIWALKETNSDGEAQEGSKKLYKVLTITHQQANIFSISAVEHYNEKYEEVEQRYQVGVTPPTVLQGEQEPDLIPPAENLVLRVEKYSDGSFKLVAEWDSPTNFDALSHFEVYHNDSADPRPNPIETGDNLVSFTPASSGTYNIKVRVVSSRGKYSTYIEDSIELGRDLISPEEEGGAGTGEGIERIHGLPSGIVSDSNTQLTNNGNTFGFENANAIVASRGDQTDSVTMTTQTIDVSGLPSGQEAYVIFDHSSASIGLYEWNTSILNGIGFWRPLGTGSGGQTEFTQVTGTNTGLNSGNVYVIINIATQLTTLATTEPGDIIAFKSTVPSSASPVNGNTDRVAIIQSQFTQTSTAVNTLILDRNLGTLGYKNAWIPAFRPDPTKDAVVAKLTG